jgi:peroxiredoxin
MPLAPGDEFPNLKLDGVGGRVELRDRWRRGPLVVMFMRHFGCAFCREQLIKVGRANEDFAAAGAEVVAIFQYSAEATRDYCASRKVPFECLGDPLREAYLEVSVGRAKLGQVYGPRILRKHVRAFRGGSLFGSPQGGDHLQLPGTFVINQDGRVLFAHYAVSSADNPPVADLLAAVRSQGVSSGSG